MYVFWCTYKVSSVRYTPRSGISELLAMHVFSFTTYCQRIFPNDCEFISQTVVYKCCIRSSLLAGVINDYCLVVDSIYSHAKLCLISKDC